MPIFDHFGFLAPFYERVIKPKAPDDLLAHLALEPDALILDAGGGTGRIAQTLAPHARAVIIADPSHKMLAQAKGKAGIQCVQAESEILPHAEGSFDAVIMVDALHHVADQAQTLRELFRVIKPGGSLVVEEPDIETFAVKLIAVGEKLLGMRSHFLSGGQISGILKACCSEARIYRRENTVWVVVKK
jgi:ubiquinone/menaquinone biosynthesis C-methylase UbiE